MTTHAPIHILDICCGHAYRHPLVLRNSAERFYPRKIVYVGIDKLAPNQVHFVKTAAPENLLRETYIPATLELENERGTQEFFSRFENESFDEIHFHMPGRMHVPTHLALLNRLAKLLKKKGRLYHTFQTMESPLLNFSLDSLGAVKKEDHPKVYLKNQERIKTAAQNVKLTLERYGTRSTENPTWMTRPDENEIKNDYKQTKIQEALKNHSFWAGGFGLHFMIFRKP